MDTNKLLSDLMKESADGNTYGVTQQLLVTISLGSSNHLEILYNDASDTSPDNIAEAKLVKTGFDRQEIILDEEEIDKLSQNGYF